MKITNVLLFALAFLATRVPLFGDASLVEFTPEGVTPKPDQRALVLAAAEKVTSLRAEYDGEGNVIGLQISNHTADTPREVTQEERDVLARRAGLDDASFMALGKLPELEALTLRKQGLLSDASFAVLQSWPELKVFRIEDRDGYRENGDQASSGDWPTHTSAYMLHLNGLTNLRWLEFKHGPGPEPTYIDKLDGFPKLERLELDHSAAQSEAVAFLQRCPNLRDFELHRTTVSNEEIGQMVAALPKLERFDLKQRNNQTPDAACLVHFSKLPHLRVFDFIRWHEDQIFWEDGVEHLVDVPSLKSIGGPWDHPAIVKLRQARPDIRKKEGRSYAVTYEYQSQTR